MGWDGMGWDGMGWDVMGWDGKVRYGMMNNAGCRTVSEVSALSL